MRTRKVLKKFLASILLAGIILILNGGQAKAALQANPSTHYIKQDEPENWIKAFRKTEQTGEAMGLEESLNADLTAVSSNNIDVHMMRTTEYGAIAILSASGYGNPQNLQDSSIQSTTGNNTGVMIYNGNSEWTAAGLKDYIFPGIDGRYYDGYEENSSALNRAKRGDALGDRDTDNPGCKSWHAPAFSDWVSKEARYFSRNNTSGIFSYYAYRAYGYYSRGVAVCGTGL